MSSSHDTHSVMAQMARMEHYERVQRQAKAADASYVEKPFTEENLSEAQRLVKAHALQAAVAQLKKPEPTARDKMLTRLMVAEDPLMKLYWEIVNLQRPLYAQEKLLLTLAGTDPALFEKPAMPSLYTLDRTNTVQEIEFAVRVQIEKAARLTAQRDGLSRAVGQWEQASPGQRAMLVSITAAKALSDMKVQMAELRSEVTKLQSGLGALQVELAQMRGPRVASRRRRA